MNRYGFDENTQVVSDGLARTDSEREHDGKKIEELKAAYKEALDTSAAYENIVNALAEDYFNLYYVNVETGEYIEYGSRTSKGQKSAKKYGTDFFRESMENARHLIYEKDQAGFMSVIDKKNLMELTGKHGTYVFHYRLLIDAVPTYVSLKAARIPDDDRHIIIGISNVDAQTKDRMAAERAMEERKAYQRISALNGDIIVLYFIDLENDHYVEFSSSRSYEDLGLAKQGVDFFRSTFENSFRTVHPEDQALFHSQITKENILAAIERDGMFVMDYRLLSGGLPTYVRLKAARIEEDGKPMLIIGLMDEDVQIRQEQEYARKLTAARTMATIDSLTGAKNKHAYVQWEETIDAEIKNGVQEPFAVVVCDVNNLKAVNDLYGHKEGDECIRRACAKICGIFGNSPVFRIGGDEFVVILTGEDYEQREKLMEQVSAIPEDPSRAVMGGTIAAGMVEYDNTRHDSLVGVFEEADKAMYERKQFIKQTLSSEDAMPEDDPVDDEIPVINIRKRILIADDIESNREILGDLLEKEYDILYAPDGEEALKVLRGNKGEIDLVILDLYMPGMNGREVITEMQVDDDLMTIPVIFLTVDQDAELDCLKIGAMDFIPKPYPDIEIVKARIAKCIELSENRDLIRHTERDKLTGLLNKDYFFRYVKRLDHIYKETGLDAFSCDVNRFHAFNKQHGRKMGDHLLRSIGFSVKKLAQKTGGIGCRQDGDTFLLYCPHQEDYEQYLREFVFDVFGGKDKDCKASIRFGVYSYADQESNIEERFVCAGIAADRVKDNPYRICGYYSEM